MTAVAAESEAAARGADQTRLRILQAARALYAAHGTRGTTTRLVADGAGVNEATVFRHFGTKQQLLAAMLDHFSTLGMPWSDLDLAKLPTLEEQLFALGSNAVESMLRKQDLVRMTMAEEITNPEAHTCAWRGPREARAMLVAYFETKIASGELRGEAEFLACAFMSLGYAYVMAQKVWAGYDRPLEHTIANMVELFLNGARA